MKRYKTIVQLINPTKKKWALFKSIDRKIKNLVKKHGVTIIETIYDDLLFIKTIIFNDINEGESKNVIFDVGCYKGSFIDICLNIYKSNFNIYAFEAEKKIYEINHE